MHLPTPLPSILLRNGDEVSMDNLTPPERKLLSSSFCGKINEAMSDYFTASPNEWGGFVIGTKEQATQAG